MDLARREAGGGGLFQYLGESFEEHNDPEGGRRIMRGLPRLIEYNAINLFQGGEMVAKL